ncbi:MAG: polyhydroxyalkanoate depolymerase [Beijerinckiaceae bacterium]
MNRSLYFMYETAHSVMAPARALSDAMRVFYQNPLNPLGQTAFGRTMAASAEMFERATRRYGKPAFDLPFTLVDGKKVAVTERILWKKSFCQLLHFSRDLPALTPQQPKVLIVAPMSGHYATLLRGTVEAFLPSHEVYITDWTDARMVPQADGTFDLDDYIDYMIEIFTLLGPDLHIMAVCQPSVPVAAAVALMEAEDHPAIPASMTLMGGPIDTRKSPTAVNKLAEERGIAWFQKNCLIKVPFPNPGFYRDVYPGFLQLSGFMAMNIDRHMTAHWDMFSHLVAGDGDSAEKQRDFYDEYLAVMDLTAEFYLQTVDVVFVKHSLPKGEMTHRGKPVDLSAVRRCALMTVEGENDDISGVGQTKATHDLCVNLSKDKQLYHLQKDVGHYGVFNGSRFRKEIAPAIKGFMAKNAKSADAKPAKTKISPTAPANRVAAKLKVVGAR